MTDVKVKIDPRLLKALDEWKPDKRWVKSVDDGMRDFIIKCKKERNMSSFAVVNLVKKTTGQVITRWTVDRIMDKIKDNE